MVSSILSCGPAPHISDHRLTALIHMHMLDPRADDLASASLSEQRTAAYAHGREITEEGGCNISARGLIAALHLGEIFQTDPVGAGFIDNGARPGRVCGPAHIAVGHGVYDQTRWAEAP